MSLLLQVFLLLLLICASPSLPSKTTELEALMTIKDSLDPQNRVLTSWTPHSDPCSSFPGHFEGVACNQEGLIANISLQGKGLSGRIPAAISSLKSLTGLYLHFNSLSGILPKEISSLTHLTDLYLNVNSLSGDIPRDIANLSNLQVLQISYNEFTGGVPSELEKLKKLSVLSLQYNQLYGAIPASLGQLESLTRLDLSFNQFFGPIPVSLASAPKLQILDVRNNSLSGNIPKALERLKGGFQYMSNPGLCGTGFADLSPCRAVISSDPVRPEPYEPGNLSTEVLPTTVQPKDIKPSKPSNIGLVFAVIAVTFASTIFGLFIVLWYRHQKLKTGTGSNANTTDTRISTNKIKEARKKIASPLISLEYSNGWDPVAKGQSGYSQEFLESLMFNLEDVERATQCFSELNLLGKSEFSSIYRGILRDGSVVVVKCIAKTSCKPDETEFLKGLKILTSLRHENLVRLRGFCCSKSRGECFLVYDFVSNGSLLRYLDVKRGDDAKILEWSKRVSIIHGIAKGIAYLHGKKGSKGGLVHQNLSADTVLLDARYNAVLAYSGLHKLLADDVVFSTLKASAAMGYLSPEYTKTGRLTEKSDVYAFGVIVFQLLSGKRDITQLSRQVVETAGFRDVVDEKLEGKFSESEAAKLWGVALLCTHESPHLRPYMEDVIQELCD